MNLSKYKITREIKWLDNLGRWVILYKSDVYPIDNIYLIPDGVIWLGNDYNWDIGKETKSIFDLNFWFICFQYEQQLKNTNVGSPDGQVQGTPEVATNA